MEHQSDSESIQRLADEVTDEVRQGKSPSSAELQERFPEISDDVGGLVDTVALLEEASFRHRTARPRGAVVNATGNTHAVLGGFRLIREISRGGMGIVYEAEQKSLNRRVAVKVLPPSPLLRDVERARFQREGRAAGRLHHSNIVPVFGTGVQQNVQYCVMQLIDGCSLDRLIACMRIRFGLAPAAGQDVDTGRGESDDIEITIDLMINHNIGEVVASPEARSATEPSWSGSEDVSNPSKFPACYWRNVAFIGARISSALSHAHQQGVLHRDIKPGNMLLDRHGHVWLTDFGLAKIVDKENLTVSGNVFGTLRYTTPEQFSGETDARSDIYSLGLTLYELCTLQPAFAGTDRRELMRKVATQRPANPRSLRADIPRDLETIILKSIRPEPENRYQTAAEQAADLRNYLEDRPLAARRQTRLQRGVRWCRQHRLETALGGFALAMLLLFSVTASVAYLNESKNRRESEANAARNLAALNRVFDSFLPDWTTSSTVSAHGSVSVSPDTARLLEELVGFYDDLAKSPGTEEAGVLDSAAALRRVGLIYLRLGRFDKSRSSYQQANRRLEQYYAKYPSKQLRLEQARVLNDLGTVNWTEQRNSEARGNHGQALNLIFEILPAPKDDVAIKFELSRSLYLAGRVPRGLGGGVLRQFGPPVSSRSRSESVARAAVILEELIDSHPENLEMRHLLALCYREYAERTLDQEGNHADQTMRDSLEMMEELVATAPDHPTYQFALCTTLQWFNFNDGPSQPALDAAAKRMERSAQIAARLSDKRPDEWIYAAARVEALIKLANVLNRAGRLQEALVQSEQAINSGTELAAKYEDCGIFQLWVGHAFRRRGDLLRHKPDLEAALQHYQLATAALEALLSSEQSDLEIAAIRDLHRASVSRGAVLEKLDRIEQSKAAMQEAGEYRKRIRVLLASER